MRYISTFCPGKNVAVETDANKKKAEEAYQKYLKELYKKKQEDQQREKEGVSFDERQKILNKGGGSGSKKKTKTEELKEQGYDVQTIGGQDYVVGIKGNAPSITERISYEQNLRKKVLTGTAVAGDLIPRGGVDLTPGNIAALKQTAEANEYNKNRQLIKESLVFTKPSTSDEQNQRRVSVLQETQYRNPVIRGISYGEALLEQKRVNNPVLASAAMIPLGAAKSVYQTAELGYDVVFNPIRTGKNIVGSTYAAVSQPSATLRSIYASATDSPGLFVGGAVGDYFTGKAVLTGLNKGTLLTRSTIAPFRAGFEEIPVESVVDISVLQGQKFPTSPSPQAAYADFVRLGQQSDGTLLSINARPIGLPKVIEAGQKGMSATEDAVVFVAPYTRGSKNFLRLGGVDYGGFSLNPLNVVNPFSSDPAFNIFRSKGIQRIPSNIVKTARGGDFTTVNTYLSNTANKGFIYQTARSTLGFTAEAEAGVVRGARVNINRPFAYTKVDGRNVPVRLVDIAEDTVRPTSRSRGGSRRTIGEVSSSSSGRRSPVSPLYSVYSTTSVASSLVSRPSISSQFSGFSKMSGMSAPSYVSNYRGSAPSYPSSGLGVSRGSGFSGGSGSGGSGGSFSSGGFSGSGFARMPPIPKPKVSQPRSNDRRGVALFQEKTKTRREFRYDPTVYSSVFNIKGSRRSGSTRAAVFTGLGNRPI